MQARARFMLIGGVAVLAAALLIVPRLGDDGGSTPSTSAGATVPTSDGSAVETDDVGLDDEAPVVDLVDLFDDPAEVGRIARSEVLGGAAGDLLEPGAGLPIISRSFAGLVADFDGDGFDDIQLSRHHNARFAPTDVDGVWLADGSGGFGFAQTLVAFADRHGCDAADVNRDGATDFYCTLGASRGRVAEDVGGELKVKSNELWINQGDATFVELGEEWGVADPWGRGRDAMFLDYDNDGDPDLYVLNAYGRLDDLRSINMLFRNDGDRFTEVDSALNGEHGFKCPAAFDWNDDGWDDVMMCNAGQPIFFENRSGEFVDVTADILAERKGWQHAVPADLDGDGDEDLAVVRKTSIEIWLWRENRGSFRQELKVDFLGEGRWIAVGDFYGDDALDVYVVVNQEDCVEVDTSSGNTHDVLLVGPEFDAFVRGSHGLGCADRAYPVDGTRLLILNGAAKTRGPVEVADLRTSVAPLLPLPEDLAG